MKMRPAFFLFRKPFVSIFQEIVGKLPMEEISIETLDPDAVLEEIYHSITQEIIDEVNIPEEALSEPEILAIMRNMVSEGRPGIQFYVRWVASVIVKWCASLHLCE